MAVHSYQTNLAGGVLSPRLFSRTDFQKYANGAEEILNGVCTVPGGCSRRAGMLYVATSKSSGGVFDEDVFDSDVFDTGPADSPVKMVPFIFNQNQAYAMEFGDQYIRFFRNREIILGDGDGTELVTNGTFDTDLSGWTVDTQPGGSATWVAGQVQLTVGGSGSVNLRQVISGLTPGEIFVLNFTLVGGGVTVAVGSVEGDDDLAVQGISDPGDYRILIEVNSTGEASLNFSHANLNTTAILDDISFQVATPLEVATPWSVNDLPYLRFAQSNDILIICSGACPDNPSPVQSLTRLADELWTLTDTGFDPMPYQPIALKPTSILTLAATSGTGVAASTDVDTFLAGDINKTISYRGGRAVITVVTDAQNITVDIIQEFLSTDPIGRGAWSLEGSPFADLDPSEVGAKGSLVTFTASADAFRSTDVGAFISIFEGVYEIITVTNATTVVARTKKKMVENDDHDPAIAGNWALNYEAWSEILGYPSVCAFEDQRLWLGATPARPKTLWGSRTGDFFNFTLGVNDDDACEYNMAVGGLDILTWLRVSRNFFCGTQADELSINGENDGPLTPTGVRIKPETHYGAIREVDALATTNAILFVQAGAKSIRELAYDPNQIGQDNYTAPDLTILADHLFRTGIHDLDHASSPHSYILALVNNGRLNVCTYERTEQVVAWTQFVTQGDFLSVCVIPNNCGTGQEIWAATRRTIGGSERIFIEVFDGQLQTDAALVAEGEGIFAVSGLEHLEGAEVQVKTTSPSVFDPNVFDPNVFHTRGLVQYETMEVDGGVITLDTMSNRVEVGLGYTFRIKTLDAELAGPQGTLHFRRKRPHTVYVRFLCPEGTPGPIVNGETVDFSTDPTAEVFDYRREGQLGWKRKSQTVITQRAPFHTHVLGISHAWQADDGDAP